MPELPRQRHGGRPPVTVDPEINRLYAEQRLTAEEIADRVLLSPSAIYRRLDAAGIRRRPRGPRTAVTA